MADKPSYKELERRVKKLEKETSKFLGEGQKAEHLSAVLRSISKVTELIIREKNRDNLVQGVCNTLLEHRGYYNAWIALFDESGGLVTTAEAGLGKDFLPMIKLLQLGELTDCAERAFEQSGVVLTHDPFATCNDCPLSKKYSGRGGMTIRLEHEGKAYGLLSVSIPRELVGDEEEHDLLEELAGEIALALYNIELQEERKQIEQALHESTYELSKRAKELNCLYSISRLLEKPDISLQQIIQGTIEFIPPAWQFPEITCARVILEGKEFKTSNFEESNWRQNSDVIVHGEPSGTLEVYYLEERHEIDEGPFMAEERALINAIAERLGKTIERRQAEEALLESEKRFRDLVENSLTGISIMQDNRIAYQNPEQERLLGPLPRSPKFTDIKSIHPDDIENVKQFHENITSGKVRSQEIDFRFCPQGQIESGYNVKWVNCRASLIKYRGKEAIMVNMMDITKTKELENMLRIQDKMTSLGRVAAGIAHEIRNPLSGINIYLNTLEKIYDRGGNLEKIRGILGQAQSASSKIESVIRRVMDFSKPSTPKLILADINQPIEDAISLASISLRKRGVKIENILDEDLPQCHIDQQLIEQVILNLITNAAQSMKNQDGEKKIEVVSSIKNSYIFISVSDSGPGVSDDVRDKIFEPFYTTKNGSTGIGLSLCHRIITDHGGSLVLSDSKLGGAQFTIEIPVGNVGD